MGRASTLAMAAGAAPRMPLFEFNDVSQTGVPMHPAYELSAISTCDPSGAGVRHGIPMFVSNNGRHVGWIVTLCHDCKAVEVTDAERHDEFPAKACASPIGGMVKPVAPKKKARGFLSMGKKRRLDSE